MKLIRIDHPLHEYFVIEQHFLVRHIIVCDKYIGFHKKSNIYGKASFFLILKRHLQKNCLAVEYFLSL